MGTKKQVAKVLFPLMADWDWVNSFSFIFLSVKRYL